MATTQQGDVIAGRYTLGETLGEGGMGCVFAAEDSVLSRSVAIKLLHPEISARKDAKRRFVREAKVAASLSHANAVRIFDFGDDNGRHFIAMERLHGQNLAEKIEEEGKMSVATTVRIAYDVADVLCTAHEQNLIHRDIKPDNIFIESQTGRVVVLDFGMAFLREGDDVDVGRITTDGLSGGTPAYMAPEQCGGVESTSATDVYALGCVIFEALVALPPFVEEHTTKYFIRHLYDVPEKLSGLRSDVPRALEELVVRMLEKRPEDRPTTPAVRKRLAGLDENVLAARERSRDASYLSNRAARAIPRPTPAIPVPSPDGLSVVIIGDQDSELRLGLAAVGVHSVVANIEELDQHASLDAIYLLDTDLERIAAAITSAGDRPVLVGASGLDIDQIKAFLRIGVADVVTRPRSAAQLAAKLRRLTHR